MKSRQCNIPNDEKRSMIQNTYEDTACMHDLGFVLASYVSPLFTWTIGGENLAAEPNLIPKKNKQKIWLYNIIYIIKRSELII